jgi:hypothetical protein
MDEPVVKITLTKTYEKLDGLEKQVSSDFSEIKLSLQEVQLTLKAFADHERRIRTLEEWRWKQAGVAALLGSIPSALIVLLLTRMFGLQ